MSLYDKVYHSTDTGCDAPGGPPAEQAELVCPECAALLYSGQSVRVEGLFHDIVGCELCSEWRQVEDIQAPPATCPNCGEETADSGEVLLSEGGLPLACDCCASDAPAAYHCLRAVDGLESVWPGAAYRIGTRPRTAGGKDDSECKPAPGQPLVAVADGGECDRIEKERSLLCPTG